jgi:hypothetical protein
MCSGCKIFDFVNRLKPVDEVYFCEKCFSAMSHQINKGTVMENTTTILVRAISVGLIAAAHELEIGLKKEHGTIIGDDEDENSTPPPAKRGRKPKMVEVEDEDTSDDEDEVETPPPAKRGRKPAPVVEDLEDEDDSDDEDDSEDDSDEDEDDSDDEDEDEPTVSPKDLAKIKKALDAYSVHHKSKQKAVKVLLKFAPTAQQVKTSQVVGLLKALKV